ncbi:hypothetical protein SEA_VANLEE_140 [Gordonia phage VanLee]|uniref:Uncharacterized protein n=1 Tax=Gordonia phage VanLee TaxID=2845816 RepID=A0A8F2DAG4_9CAUD|nr:hypothetical protein QEH49_gp150 [Gordonia phage VanLee]QWS68256.1 hypothetical protein SEA_VANLEE_140 [Gordonia phage VanLee]
MTDTTSIAERTTDLDLIAYAVQRALRNGASYDQVNDALAYTVARVSRDPHAEAVSTSRVGHAGLPFEELEEAMREYNEFQGAFDSEKATTSEQSAHDEREVDYLYAIRDAAQGVV